MNWRLYREACHDAGLDERITIMNHTPGPWEINHTSNDSVILIDAEYLRITVDCRENFGDAEANARLIAAAPELLEACKLALNAFEKNWTIDWSILETAIAKAEGHDDGNGNRNKQGRTEGER